MHGNYMKYALREIRENILRKTVFFQKVCAIETCILINPTLFTCAGF